MTSLSQMLPQEFWQQVYAPGTFATGTGYTGGFPAALQDGRQICLPIRPMAGGERALASLIVNQASFSVLDALAQDLAAQLKPVAPEVIVGLPTLGLTLACEVARKLGHTRYVPLGTSRKFWYDEGLSVPLSSITTPDQMKRLYVDPRMLPLLAGRRVALVDDVISSGRSIRAGLALLAAIEVRPVATGAAMLQSDVWRQPENAPYAGWQNTVRGCLTTPVLERGHDGLWHSPGA